MSARAPVAAAMAMSMKPGWGLCTPALSTRSPMDRSRPMNWSIAPSVTVSRPDLRTAPARRNWKTSVAKTATAPPAGINTAIMPSSSRRSPSRPRCVAAVTARPTGPPTPSGLTSPHAVLPSNFTNGTSAIQRSHRRPGRDDELRSLPFRRGASGHAG